MMEPHVYTDIMHMVDCILNDTEPEISVEHGRHVVEIVEMAFESARTGMRKELRTTFPFGKVRGDSMNACRKFLDWPMKKAGRCIGLLFLCALPVSAVTIQLAKEITIDTSELPRDLIAPRMVPGDLNGDGKLDWVLFHGSRFIKAYSHDGDFCGQR
jgi:hypothetical protein